MDYFLFLLRNYSSKKDQVERKGAEKDCFFDLEHPSFSPLLKDFLSSLLRLNGELWFKNWKELKGHTFLKEEGLEGKKEERERVGKREKEENERGEEEEILGCTSLVGIDI